MRTSEDFSLADLLDVCREAGKPVCVEREREREREERERERERLYHCMRLSVSLCSPLPCLVKVSLLTFSTKKVN